MITELVGVVISSLSNNYANYYIPGDTIPVLISIIDGDIRNTHWGDCEEMVKVGDCVFINTKTNEITKITEEML